MSAKRGDRLVYLFKKILFRRTSQNQCCGTYVIGGKEFKYGGYDAEAGDNWTNGDEELKRQWTSLSNGQPGYQWTLNGMYLVVGKEFTGKCPPENEKLDGRGWFNCKVERDDDNQATTTPKPTTTSKPTTKPEPTTPKPVATTTPEPQTTTPKVPAFFPPN